MRTNPHFVGGPSIQYTSASKQLTLTATLHLPSEGANSPPLLTPCNRPQNPTVRLVQSSTVKSPSTPTMHDTYTHTEPCTQVFKDHLRAHLASRKQSLSSGNTFTSSGPVVSNTSNMSSAETLKPVDAPNCVCGLTVKNDSEHLHSGKLAGATNADGPICDCARRVTVIGEGVAAPPEVKKSFKSKALDVLCSACTGYVAKPKAGGFYPDAE
jgi:hypothetical protein